MLAAAAGQAALWHRGSAGTGAGSGCLRFGQASSPPTDGASSSARVDRGAEERRALPHL